MDLTTQRDYNSDMEKYEELCDYRRRAFEFISQALKCEETGDSQNLAESLYRVIKLIVNYQSFFTPDSINNMCFINIII